MISNDFSVKANVLLDEKIGDHSTISFSTPSGRIDRHDDRRQLTVKRVVNYSGEAFCNKLMKINLKRAFETIDRWR